MLTHLIETQGLLGGLQPMRHKNRKRKRGQHRQDLERADGSVRIDPDRALRVLDSCLLLLLVSNVWCVLTIEHFTAQSRVFPSAQMGNKLQAAAGTTALEFGRRLLARACRP